MAERCRKGAFEMSFSMIFSIILIIAFVAAGFYVIRTFFTIKGCAEIGTFYSDLQTSITNAWKSPATSRLFTTTLPTGFEYVCIINWTDSGRGTNAGLFDEMSVFGKNLVMWPKGKACKGFEGTDIVHVNLNSIISQENPFCIKVDKGKVSLMIEKPINENLVKIENA